jgi:HD domain
VNRRELVQGLGVLSVNGVTHGCRPSLSHILGDRSASVARDSDRLPPAVAGIRLMDSTIARKAVHLARANYAPYLFNHAVRTFLLGSLIGRARGQRFNEEFLFLACILHDLGLTERFEGDLPFEIQGAEAAKRFLEGNAYAEEGTQTVWDGIAMHASAIGQFKRPEIALVGEGAGADVLGPDFSQVKQNDVDEIVKAFPRLGFKLAFVETCADIVRKHPKGASRGFMRDIGERYVRDFHPRNFCDLLVQAPFSE